MGRQNPRSHTRYRVSEQQAFPVEVEISVNRMPVRHTLFTVGLGGFGFFGSSKLADLLRKGAVPMHFLIGHKRVEILGRARYCQFLPHAVKDAPYFVGVQYEALQPDVQNFLKTLIQAGLIKGHLSAQGAARSSTASRPLR